MTLPIGKAVTEGITSMNTKPTDIHVVDLPVFYPHETPAFFLAERYGECLAQVVRTLNNTKRHKDDPDILAGIVAGFVRSLKQMDPSLQPYR
jgi:hypothetical protein